MAQRPLIFLASYLYYDQYYLDMLGNQHFGNTTSVCTQYLHRPSPVKVAEIYLAISRQVSICHSWHEYMIHMCNNELWI